MLNAEELRRLARALAHGAIIKEFTSHPETGIHTQLYYKWMAWKCAYPKIASRFKRLSRETYSERRRKAFEAKKLTSSRAWVLVDPPDNIWQIIESVVPHQIPGELRSEICQRLAIEVLERRCECDPQALSKALTEQRSLCLREYANPWKNVPLFEEY